MKQPVYVLGTGLSHNGSAVLLKDGEVCVAIEKERVTRRKHDGGNDTDAITYCLEAEGITLGEVLVVVQCANFEIPDWDRFGGKRLFAGNSGPQRISISHHLAHAYSAAGTCPYDEALIMVIDGCGSPFGQCTDLPDALVFPENLATEIASDLWCEKDSTYHFDGRNVKPLLKDFSPLATPGVESVRMQTTQHSIGGFYAAVSHYVFGNMDDVGKLMGLAPYGRPGTVSTTAFEMKSNRLFLCADWNRELQQPSAGYADFRNNFQYYADVAYWAQQQVEAAVMECMSSRLAQFPHHHVCYSGGVALNAVANARLLNERVMKDLYMEPAAGDNGLALGCAFYGWMQVLGQPRRRHNGNTCFGKRYSDAQIETAIRKTTFVWKKAACDAIAESVAQSLAAGKIVGWFCGGSEFGPRALGHRSILAHPGIPGLGDKINAAIKFREDFRPFAPVVLPDFATGCFESGRPSPYMILVDRTRPEWREKLCNVTHVNGTARVQTIDPAWNPELEELLQAFHRITEIPVLLNTSLNKKGMPMVEAPEDALALFAEGAMDILVMEHYIVVKDASDIAKLTTFTVDQTIHHD
jgi:carbamoyltransferase